MTRQWQWDETLFLGSAPYYVQGRLPYAPTLPDRLRDALGLDRTGRLLDVGCGPGVLTLPLAPHFAQVVAVDPDAGMLREGARRAEIAKIKNIRWVEALGEALSSELGTFRVATFAQSFHWMDQPLVARLITGMLEPDGAFVHVADLKDPLPLPPAYGVAPPFEAIAGLTSQYLGPIRRAGRSLYLDPPQNQEAKVLTEAGYRGPERLIIPNGAVVERTVDDLVAWTFSRSVSTPHLLADRRDDFERDLRALLHAASPDGVFTETLPDTEVNIWRRPVDL